MTGPPATSTPPLGTTTNASAASSTVTLPDPTAAANSDTSPVKLRTHCPYCALQCAMTLTRVGSESPAYAEIPAQTGRASGPENQAGAETATGGYTVAGAEFPTNRGRLCRKGATAGELLAPRPDRITAPLIRSSAADDAQTHQGDPSRHPGFREASWDEVLDLIAQRLRSIQTRYGKDAVGVFGSGGLTNEKAYGLGKFARVGLGTSQIDYNGRFCMSSASKASTLAFGVDRGLPFPLSDLDTACTILLLGSNIADTMPPFVQHIARARENSGLIVVDPRRSATAELTAEGAGVHLAPAPGGDLVLLLALANVIFEEGFTDTQYLRERVNGITDFRRSAARWWPERAQVVTGVSAQTIRVTARRLGHAAFAARSTGAPVYILTGRGVEQHHDGTDTARAAISLALILGLPGARRSSDNAPRGGYGTLTGQGNGQGGREMGQKSDQLPGIRSISSPADREHMARVWGVAESSIPGPGLPATQLLHRMGTTDAQGTAQGVQALLVHGSNIAISAPDAARVVQNLRALDFLVVADFFMSETAAEADVVLPVLQWAEEDGTMTNLEGRILRRRRLVEAPEGARSELWIWAELARRMGSPAQFDTEPSAVFEEIREATSGASADYSGLSWEDTDTEVAPFWPVPDATPAAEKTSTGEAVLGAPRMFLEGFAHPDAKARLADIQLRPQISRQPGELSFTTGRVMEHYQSGNQTRRVESLQQASPQVTVQMHPVTAAEHGLDDGDYAVVENSRGAMIAQVVLDTGLRTDTLFSAFHYPGQARANLLTHGVTDPQSSMPEFKNTPARLRAVTAQELADHQRQEP